MTEIMRRGLAKFFRILKKAPEIFKHQLPEKPVQLPVKCRLFIDHTAQVKCKLAYIDIETFTKVECMIGYVFRDFVGISLHYLQPAFFYQQQFQLARTENAI